MTPELAKVETPAPGPAAGPGTRPVIDLDHVTKSFGSQVAVHDAHFTIAEGEFFSMLGTCPSAWLRSDRVRGSPPIR